MNKEFVSFDIALALKELGFDEPCLANYYAQDNGLTPYRGCPSEGNENTHFSTTINGNLHDGSATAPLYQQAFRWFREKHHIHIEIKYYNDGDEWEDIEYTVIVSDFEDGKTHDTFVKSGYTTYEEAELACLNKLIELIKEK